MINWQTNGNLALAERMERKTEFNPKIAIFNPFEIPFSKPQAEQNNKPEITISIVAPEVKRYMRSGHRRLEIVAKCTPCQCCACR